MEDLWWLMCAAACGLKGWAEVGSGTEQSVKQGKCFNTSIFNFLLGLVSTSSIDCENQVSWEKLLGSSSDHPRLDTRKHEVRTETHLANDVN